MSSELGAFLRSRRARLQPADVGLPGGGRRRVGGLRREEVAALAAISLDYVARLEQGRIRPSDEVLEALARALRLDAAERAHLRLLAGRPGMTSEEPAPHVRPTVLRLVASLDPLPAYVISPSLDLLAWNPTASLLLGGLERLPASGRNVARLVFLDPGAAAVLGSPERTGEEVVAALRVARARTPRDTTLAALLDELHLGSAAFRSLWARQDVTAKDRGRKTFTSPHVGSLELEWERLGVPGTGGQCLMVYSAEPGSPSATALRLLGALAASQGTGARL